MTGWIQDIFCSGLKQSLSSLLPWDIPWYDPSHVVFFAAVYGALSVIGIGILWAAILTLRNMNKSEDHGHH